MCLQAVPIHTLPTMIANTRLCQSSSCISIEISTTLVKKGPLVLALRPNSRLDLHVDPAYTQIPVTMTGWTLFGQHVYIDFDSIAKQYRLRLLVHAFETHNPPR